MKLQQISSRKQLYGKVIDLTEEEKQTISERFQLASGLAVAACCGDFDDVCAAIKSSKNAVENNALGKALGKEKKQLKASLPSKKEMKNKQH
ncbi:VENN motif pre-toxin domain-containing protein [Gilliamella apis]|uniref:VENN motif pre-toxin domain-containing protein n=1 Tax=Gilliamella apis TaxID=1970738 RepID=UPI0013FE0200|nr:VENN motif pre-toxin domain-containing protein [Gilliamella apis]